jgi:hypothetical protein
VRTASRVFGAIGLFAFAAAVLFLIGGRDRSAVQGTLVLALFGLANTYLWRVLGTHGRSETDGLVVIGAPSLDEVQHNDPESLHLPGPSIAPLVFAVAAGLILVGFLYTLWLVAVGIALFVVASAGWAIEAFREYRIAVQHGTHDDQHTDLSHNAVAVGHRIAAFRSLHGGATASVQHIGRGHSRVVLVGADGEWGEVFVRDVGTATQGCALAGVEAPQTWAAGLGSRMRNSSEFWDHMGGHAPAVVHGPRDGYLQVGARVFLSIGIFAFFAAALFLAGWRNRAAVQGTLILTMFGIANVYLYVFMRNARGGPDDHRYAAASGIAAEPMEPEPAMDPDHIHLPGPSIWPAVFAVGGGLLLVGLITSLAISILGLALFAAAAAGWAVQAFAEYRQSLAAGHGGQGGSHGDSAVAVDHVTAGTH